MPETATESPRQHTRALPALLLRSGRKMESEGCTEVLGQCYLATYPHGQSILPCITRHKPSLGPKLVSSCVPIGHVTKFNTDNWFVANVYASLCGGACSTMATNPIWVIKTRLMSQSSSRSDVHHSKAPWHYRNTWDAARKMYLHEGALSFYSGLTPALLGLAHVAIQFPLYEVFKERFTGISRGAKESDEDRSHHFYSLALAVFLSKVCASTATYPHEVVRTRLQTQQRSTTSRSFQGASHKQGAVTPAQATKMQRTTLAAANGLRPKGTLQICRVIYLEEGWRGFYAGLGANLIRTIPSAMTTILTFEYLKKTLFYIQQDQEGTSKSI